MKMSAKTNLIYPDGSAVDYTYDYENRLIKAIKQESDETKTITFKYDPFGRRIEKKTEEAEDGETETKTYTYLYDNEDIILEYLTNTDDNETKTETTKYIHGTGIDEPLAIERKGEIYYYHADGLGSITTLTDKKQKTVESYTYTSFGEVKQKGDKVKNTFTFTGREYDKETGLYYYRARYYDPKAGRFITKDPIGFEGGINIYLYTGNNPINYVDPHGLLGEKEVKTELDNYFGNRLSEITKQKIADFTGKYIRPWDIPGLLTKDPKALEALEERARKGLEKADEATKRAFEEAERVKNEIEKERQKGCKEK